MSAEAEKPKTCRRVARGPRSRTTALKHAVAAKIDSVVPDSPKLSFGFPSTAGKILFTHNIFLL